MGGGTEADVVETPFTPEGHEESTVVSEDEASPVFPTASDLTGGGTEHQIELVVDNGGGTILRKRRESAIRVVGATAASLVGVVPWALGVGVESLVRKGTGGNDQFTMQGVGWSFLSTVYNDVTNLSTLSSAYSSMRWSFPPEFSTKIIVACSAKLKERQPPKVEGGAPQADASVASDEPSTEEAGAPEASESGEGQGEGQEGAASTAGGEAQSPEDEHVAPAGSPAQADPEIKCGLVALTIDDAPGDNPEAFSALLDVLKEFGARASFFCTTCTLESCGGAMKPLVERALREGHELCNHCTADRPYHLDSPAAFQADLDAAAAAIEPFVVEQARAQERLDERKHAVPKRGSDGSDRATLQATHSPLTTSWVDVKGEDGSGSGSSASGGGPTAPKPSPLESGVNENEEDVPFLSSTHRRWKWFRPPSGMMSTAMAAALKDRGYSCVLGDVFSNDVFVGGNFSGRSVGPKTVAYHVEYCASRTKPGSIVIFHSPQANRRLMSPDLVRAYLESILLPKHRTSNKGEDVEVDSAGAPSASRDEGTAAAAAAAEGRTRRRSSLWDNIRAPAASDGPLRCVTLSELANAVVENSTTSASSV